MAEKGDSPAYDFYYPEARGQLSIGHLHIPRRLRKTALRFPYKIKIDTDFAGVIDGCAEVGRKRSATWINPPIRQAFIELHAMGYAHSVECWSGKKLVGGLYGLALGRVFCGESMFSRARDASKIALLHLTARLWKAGFSVLDTQLSNPHLEQFGIHEITQNDYMALIETEMNRPADFLLKGRTIGEQHLLQEYLEFLETHSPGGDGTSGSVSDGASVS